MQERIENARGALEAPLEALRRVVSHGGDATALRLAENQLARLAALGRQVEHAMGASLAGLRGEVAAYVAAAQIAAQRAHGSVASGEAETVSLHASLKQAKRATGAFLHDYYERKIFEPYLTFASPEEERAYREREETRRKAIETAQDENTPEGTEQALRLSIEQLQDAGNHGADKSPDYQPMVDKLWGTHGATVRPVEQAPTHTTAKIMPSESHAVGADTPQTETEIAPALLAQICRAGMSLDKQHTDLLFIPPAPAKCAGVGRE